MCISPIRIKNPNFGLSDKGLGCLKDCSSAYINIPCGHCSECVHNKQLGYVQRCQIESLNSYPFMVTLTYNNASLPSIKASSGYTFKYADISDVQNMIKRIRNGNLFGRKFRYFFVSELGSKRSRPHFHGLFFLEKLPDDNVYTPINLEQKLFDVVLINWSRNIGSKRNPVYVPCSTFIRKNIAGKLSTTFDLHYVVPSNITGSSSDVSFYVTKYLLKTNDKLSKIRSALKLNLPEYEYLEIWDKIKPKKFYSKNFGFGSFDDFNCRSVPRDVRLSRLSFLDSFKYIRKCVDNSTDFPKFYDVETGASMPLSRYYRSFGKLYTLDDAKRFNDGKNPDNVIIDSRHVSEKLNKVSTLKRQIHSIDEKSTFIDSLFND